MAEKPKRPLSAYMLWLNSAREGIKKENPGIKVTEIAKKGGELWRGMKDKTVSFNTNLPTQSTAVLTFQPCLFVLLSNRSGRTRPPR